jgi:hypothetical protein
MTQINHEWAIETLESSIRTASVTWDGSGWRRNHPISDVQGKAQVVEQILVHPWVWGSVQGVWGSGHYRQAVAVAAVAVNAQAQAKVGRKDLSEWKLLNDAFGLKDPEPGKPCLRLAPKEDSDTWRSRHEGAAAFARGVYAGIRNPIAHEAGDELEENEALEQLAASSILVRWIDMATVEKAL